MTVYKPIEIGFGVYLSPWDMYQRERGLWDTEEYNTYFLAHLEELLTRYGSVDEVWFDGACSDYEIWNKVPSYRSMISNFGLYLSNIPDDINKQFDNIVKDIEVLVS